MDRLDAMRVCAQPLDSSPYNQIGGLKYRRIYSRYGESYFAAARRRAISNSATAAATDTLSEPTLPRIGMSTTKSAPFLTMSRTPRPSDHTIIASLREVSSV